MNNATRRGRNRISHAVSLQDCDDLLEEGFAGLIEDALNAYVEHADDAPATEVSSTNETFRPNVPYTTQANLRVRIGKAEFLVAVSRVD